MSKSKSSTGWIAVVVVVIGVVAAGLYLWRTTKHPPQQVSTPSTVNSLPQTAPAQHPISEVLSGPAAAATAPLPALDESDASVATALGAMASGSPLDKLLVERAIIPRMVATINALPDKQVAQNIMPVHPPTGSFLVQSEADSTVMNARNSDRYGPYMKVVEGVDSRTLVDWYVRRYPLFQDAYRQLGYPDGHFNDRLVFVIDQLLATPDISQPVALKPTKSMFVFVDPKLEALSAGQKALIRLGPTDEKAVKAKLAQIRLLLVGQAPATGTSAGN